MSNLEQMDLETTKYKVWTWRNPLMLHWILNPGLVINELILGQRIPKLTLIERDRNKTLAERSFIPCPHCNTIHSALKWSPQNKTAFKNWFGLYCDNCGKTIPCLRNLTSLILLTVTFPIWVWFKNRLKNKWLLLQKNRFSKALNLTTPGYNWVSEGLSFGIMMFIFMELLINPLIDGKGYDLLNLGLGLIIWLLGGLAYGFAMKKFLFKQLSKHSPE
jgi:hypothetical protein